MEDFQPPLKETASLPISGQLLLSFEDRILSRTWDIERAAFQYGVYDLQGTQLWTGRSGSVRLRWGPGSHQAFFVTDKGLPSTFTGHVIAVSYENLPFLMTVLRTRDGLQMSSYP
jgi:hypothetical protein